MTNGLKNIEDTRCPALENFSQSTLGDLATPDKQVVINRRQKNYFQSEETNESPSKSEVQLSSSNVEKNNDKDWQK